MSGPGGYNSLRTRYRYEASGEGADGSLRLGRVRHEQPRDRLGRYAPQSLTSESMGATPVSSGGDEQEHRTLSGARIGGVYEQGENRYVQ